MTTRKTPSKKKQRPGVSVTEDQIITYGVFVGREHGDRLMHRKATFDDLDAALDLARWWLHHGLDVEIDPRSMSRAEFEAYPDATKDQMRPADPTGSAT